MPTVTKFIIALDPAAPCYALSFDVRPCDIFRTTAATRAVPTAERTEAQRFDTYEAAAEVARDITGWGGAQRVEAIEVEVAGPSLNDPATRIEARDIATAAFAEANETEIRLDDAVDAAADALRAEGYRVGVEVRNGAASFASLHLTDPFGVCLTLDWEPTVDGFDYETSGDDALEIEDRLDAFEDENPDDDCDSADLADFVQGYLEGLFWTRGHCRDFLVANKAALDEAILAYWEPCAEGFDYATSGDDACDLGEEAAQHEPEPDDDGTPCDGCDSTEGEDAGDGFAFCAECRAKDAAAPRSEDENPDDDCDSADLADFVQGYLEGLFWTSMPSPEDDGRPMSTRTLEALGYRIDQLAPACRSAHEGHCRDFLVANKAALDEAILAYGATTTPSQVGYRERYTLRMAGLDFWLSRNGHGAGFFDRGREGCWTRLQRAAKVYGACEIVSVEDGGQHGPTIVTVEA